MNDKRRGRVFPKADKDVETAHDLVATPQTQSPTYRLAFDDPEFLLRDELRPVRMQLELLKPEMMLSEAGVSSTIVMFGGARIPAPGGPARSQALSDLSPYYKEARTFARRVTEYSLAQGGQTHVVVTGGGPGVMEAGCRGAVDAGGRSVTLNIMLPHEQAPNPWATPELAFNFHYFAIRKMHFLLRARAVTVFPGGFGTLDELFEVLTLVQTGRMERLPILLFGETFWRTIIDWDALAAAGTISEDDLTLFQFVEDAETAWSIVRAAEE